MLDTFEHHTYAVKLDCRYLLHVPTEMPANPLLVLTLHGYSSNPQAMLSLTAAMVGKEHIVASLQAPNQHYLTQGLPGASSTIGYNWGVRDHWGTAVTLHHDMLLEALSILRKRFGVPAQRCLLVGFSQPVGMNYRFVGTHPDQAGGVIGVCGGVPRDWDEDKYGTVTAPILHISRDQDEFFPSEVAMQFPERLKKHATDVEFHMLPGGHRFPSKAGQIAKPWMARVFGT